MPYGLFACSISSRDPLCLVHKSASVASLGINICCSISCATRKRPVSSHFLWGVTTANTSNPATGCDANVNRQVRCTCSWSVHLDLHTGAVPQQPVHIARHAEVSLKLPVKLHLQLSGSGGRTRISQMNGIAPFTQNSADVMGALDMTGFRWVGDNDAHGSD